MYPLDLLTLPRSFLRRTRAWYARGRTWRREAARGRIATAGRHADRADTARNLTARAG
ncbi:MAG TPA: hypothetical protein VFW33_13220 [Gemmataceae bacterium]|nr:hypothetical protein [Gemmataceae bacterium]